jgi:hypothetical protein
MPMVANHFLIARCALPSGLSLASTARPGTLPGEAIEKMNQSVSENCFQVSWPT